MPLVLFPSVYDVGLLYVVRVCCGFWVCFVVLRFWGCFFVWLAGLRIGGGGFAAGCLFCWCLLF